MAVFMTHQSLLHCTCTKCSTAFILTDFLATPHVCPVCGKAFDEWVFSSSSDEEFEDYTSNKNNKYVQNW